MCDADAVIVGKVKKAKAKLTENKKAIYTEYEIELQEILGDDKDFPFQNKTRIKVGRFGGYLKINGRKILEKYKAFAPLKVNENYLLFLNSLPEKGAYVATYSEGSLWIKDNNTVEKLTEGELPEPLKVRLKLANELLGFVKSRVQQSCINK